MVTRYTVSDVRAAFERAVKCARAAGLDPTDWVLQEAETGAGRPYRLFGQQGSGLRNLSFTAGNGYLGSTAREASEILHAYASAWWAVAELGRGNHGE